jgi:hypothetical protein
MVTWKKFNWRFNKIRLEYVGTNCFKILFGDKKAGKLISSGVEKILSAEGGDKRILSIGPLVTHKLYNTYLALCLFMVRKTALHFYSLKN